MDVSNQCPYTPTSSTCATVVPRPFLRPRYPERAPGSAGRLGSGAGECYGCSEVEESWLDCLVHAQTISNIAHTVLSASCGQTKSRHMGFRANRRQPLDRLISGLPVIPAQSRTPPASSIGRDLQAVSTKSHAAPAASSLLAGIVEVQHTLSTLADAVRTGFGEQCCCAVR